MLPIDDDILATRYHDDARAASWYINWRNIGATPQQAIDAVEELRSIVDDVFALITNLPSEAQIAALQRYAEAVGSAVQTVAQAAAVLQACPSDWADAASAPLTHEHITALVEDAIRVSQIINEQLRVK